MILSLAMDQNLAQQMRQMISSGVVAQSLAAAAELDVADQLARGGKTTAQLASLVNANEEKLHRLLRFLASLGIFQLDSNNQWQLTPAARFLLSDEPGSVRAGARMLGRGAAAYAHLTDTIRTGTL